ncbi:hypothetical protein WA1_29985 [Scytonema hofmannii PCC 7110]|uniref:SMODS and SLOG-associating 2TM effector domain-containing protein n=1 Tax=Scytonema hofmannii PCC 7110 TaxID=128403 RepID=A0A139X523_9CYAN|nr:SLATT domain-containing protein [Scytonema hofmannii]KYC39785.1 hypothetical protein WA1_29985 [Scytonema hofmannii PCC 7110]
MQSLTSKNELLKQCESDILRFEKEKQSHSKYADYWGKTYLILGVSGTIFSALCAVLTFSEYKIQIALLAALSAILTGLLAFLNPNQREQDRRKAARDCNNYVTRVQAFVAEIGCYKTPEEMLKEYKVLTNERNELVKTSKY